MWILCTVSRRRGNSCEPRRIPVVTADATRQESHHIADNHRWRVLRQSTGVGGIERTVQTGAPARFDRPHRWLETQLVCTRRCSRPKLITAIRFVHSVAPKHPEVCHSSDFRVRSHPSRRAVETTTAAIWLARVGDRDRRVEAISVWRVGHALLMHFGADTAESDVIVSITYSCPTHRGLRVKPKLRRCVGPTHFSRSRESHRCPPPTRLTRLSSSSPNAPPPWVTRVCACLIHAPFSRVLGNLIPEATCWGSPCRSGDRRCAATVLHRQWNVF